MAAEAALFDTASRLIPKIAYPALKGAYKGGKSIVKAREALDKLRETIQTIQARFLDAEKNQSESASVKNGIKRLKGVVYDAEDLFDKVGTDDMLKQQIKGDTILSKVWVSSFKLNPIASRISIAKKVESIRKRLLEISTDMAHLTAICGSGVTLVTGASSNEEDRFDAGRFLDSKDILGREEDKKSILKMIFNESNNAELVSVIVIVGIAGMGKTALANLVINDQEIVDNFDYRWFACISNTSDDKEVIGKIFESICEKNYRSFTVIELSEQLRQFINGKKFLLVLDGVSANDCSRLENQRMLLSRGAKGSTILVTTTSLSVERAMKAVGTHHLKGLSDDKSWALFKKLAYDRDQERNEEWIRLGKEIVKKCANVPLAIRWAGNHLCIQNSMGEWESFINEELSQLRQSGQMNKIMSVLKSTYDQLDSDLQKCFAYCSLFPKNHIISRQELIYLWIAQGYIIPIGNQTVEQKGHSCFMDLIRMSLLQMDTIDLITGDVLTCRMHDLIHDLAQLVAEDENITLTTPSPKIERTRHVSVGYSIDDSRAIPAVENKVKWLRSFLCMGGGSVRRQSTLIQEFAKYKSLRALSLKKFQIENVSRSIGKLKYLRYLDLSETTLTSLPESITQLLNLLKLDVHECKRLEVLPNDFRKLISLRHLDIRGCDHLKHMPPRFGELSSLQQLDEFKVGSGDQRSKLEELIGLKLRGKLKICFQDDTDDWSEVAYWQPPLTLRQLSIVGYSGVRIPNWAGGGEARLPNLTHLSLVGFSKVKCLPTFRHLPELKYLYLRDMEELDYIDEGEDNACRYLENILLFDLPKLKAWSSRVDAVATSNGGASIQEGTCSSSTVAAPQLRATLHVEGCPKLEFLALFPSLHVLSLKSVNARVISQLLSLRDSSSSSSLKHVSIDSCDGLTSFPGKSLTSLQYLYMSHCANLKDLELAPVDQNILEVLYLCGCREMELWEQKKWGVNWDSLPNLCQLRLNEVPSSQRLPPCLQRRQDLGELKIEAWTDSNPVERQRSFESLCAKYCLKEPSMLQTDHQPNALYDCLQ